MDESQPDQDPAETGEVAAPAALVAALGRRRDPRMAVPAAVDRAILERAHARLAQARSSTTNEASADAAESSRKIVRWPGLWVRLAAAAAVIALAAVVWWRPEPTAEIALDEPTVIDAFRLARRVEAGESLPPQFDLNGDGVVNATDAQYLAQRAVALPEGGAL